MDWKVVAPLVVTVVVAFAGFLATYLNGLRVAQRKDRLDRVNRQLSELYGPLLALTSAAYRSWAAFRSRYRSGSDGYFDPSVPLTEEDEQAWRRWMRSVFQPLNERMEEVVTTKADLLNERAMPDCVLQLVAHVSSHSAVMAQWDEGDFSEQVALVPFPNPDLWEYAAGTFASLKEEQQDLLGTLSPRRHWGSRDSAKG